MNFRISAKSFIVDKDNRVLILKRSMDDVHKPGVWEIPGGRLELGEDPVLGLMRETKEELGLGLLIEHIDSLEIFSYLLHVISNNILLHLSL